MRAQLALWLFLLLFSAISASADNQRPHQPTITQYFRAANEHVGALDCQQPNHRRDLSAAERAQILHRDGQRCTVCGRTDKLEVDHRRALSNGGDNSPDNLAVLCKDCHQEKTRMDNSLRRHREKLCADHHQPSETPPMLRYQRLLKDTLDPEQHQRPLSLRDLAKATRIPVSTMHDYVEMGVLPRLDNAHKIGAYYGESISSLFSDDDDLTAALVAAVRELPEARKKQLLHELQQTWP